MISPTVPSTCQQYFRPLPQNSSRIGASTCSRLAPLQFHVSHPATHRAKHSATTELKKPLEPQVAHHSHHMRANHSTDKTFRVWHRKRGTPPSQSPTTIQSHTSWSSVHTFAHTAHQVQRIVDKPETTGNQKPLYRLQCPLKLGVGGTYPVLPGQTVPAPELASDEMHALGGCGTCQNWPFARG